MLVPVMPTTATASSPTRMRRRRSPTSRPSNPSGIKRRRWSARRRSRAPRTSPSGCRRLGPLGLELSCEGIAGGRRRGPIRERQPRASHPRPRFESCHRSRWRARTTCTAANEILRSCMIPGDIETLHAIRVKQFSSIRDQVSIPSAGQRSAAPFCRQAQVWRKSCPRHLPSLPVN